ncbi:hypothetical protein PGT21_016619 [Puccinia graminis f. sp. tritici]|uniref:BED-type domain-containing protein n=1 Tax=Puccinia graminis f. sp. tritici TaxID=56615 RepID=A0A5B0P766_PUCGR|nr:hypothetical protein PGT21_016619 [Puccinia graminis f. sp. tritici]KAA1132003.1 hypothetical protein PGTUg99_035565 [Puccinia graminis f. sp. tritici]
MEGEAGYATNESQPHRRRSSRASSLVVQPNMVQPSSDSRVKLLRPVNPKRAAEPSSDVGSVRSVASVQPQAKSNSKPNKKKRRQKAPLATKKAVKTTGKTTKRKAKNDSGANSKAHSDGEPYDYGQDSTDASVEICSKSNKKKKEAEYVKVLEYFEAPVWKKGDAPGTTLNYQCKWCKVTYRAQLSSRGNLKTHCDGSSQADKNAHGCPNRNLAKQAGVELPLSVAEQIAADAKAKSLSNKQTSITDFVNVKLAFVNRVLNQLLMIWQIRQALPWTRIEDPYLRAAFQFANPKAILHGRRWSADESKKLYRVLKGNVFNELNTLDTRFTLIHDVWTTKGNRFAFIGAAAAYVNQDWKYTTTDSGSNNNTMASTMYDLLNKHDQTNLTDPSAWDPSKMHIRCICHKLALIVNAGLKALSLKTLPPGKTKESVLGFFPVLGRLTEEDEAESPEKIELVAGIQGSENAVEDEDTDSDYGNADDEVSDAEDDSAPNDTDCADETPDKN